MGNGTSSCSESSAMTTLESVEIEHVELSASTVIEYITDVEGNWDYLMRFVSMSKILYWGGEERGAWGPGTLRLRHNGMLVFGGDAPDKGPGDIRLVKTFLSLKRRFPSQVFLVLGNRDLMKMRFRAELAAGMESNSWTPPWDRNPKSLEQFLDEEKLPRSLVSKLKWMLHCNMGCQDTTFKTRKHELALPNGSATDADVLQSYCSSMDPASKDPWMLDFLLQGQIAVVLGDTLFVHGGLQDESIGVVPGQSRVYDTVEEWVKQLNLWKDAELQDFIRQPCWRTEGGMEKRGGETLIEYGTPGGGKRTVIYHNPFVDGNPVLRSPKVASFLQQSEIRRVLSGHQPHGQTPTVVRHPDTGLLVITADTSRSDGTATKLFNPAESRGSAASMVRIEGPYVYISGHFNDNSLHGCKLHVDQRQDALPDALVGRQLICGSWIKTIKNGLIVTALGKGFQVLTDELSPEHACLRLKSVFASLDMFLVNLAQMKGSFLKESNHTLSELVDDDAEIIQRSFTFKREEFDTAECYIFAMMGVLLEPDSEIGRNVVSKINEIIASKKRVLFLTNNSNYSRSSLFASLVDHHGVRLLASQLSLQASQSTDFASESHKLRHISDQHVLTSSNTCAWYLRAAGIERPFVICSSRGILDELESFGIQDYVATVDHEGKQKPEYLEEVNEERICELIKRAPDVDAIVVAWDQGLTALKAAVATQYIQWNEEQKKHLPVISCSMDASGVLGVTPADFCQGQQFQNRKIRAVGNGTMANLICNNASLQTEAINMGKPSQMLTEQLRRSVESGGLGIDFGKAVMIGSTLDTDIKFANSVGMRSLLVLSGITNEGDLLEEQLSSKLPTWVVDSLASI
ncbi:unnamed protein product [Polarella glacialis]|uniref:Calcineurin-like phosphoesterase domain-containing protein n=1 Tax=Polarella glacialis TaxID=89957 RepID=A0A813GYV6_POLGL|nr:unnamed protein product [Polarella glacialis]